MALLRLRHKPLLPRPFSSSTAPFPSPPSDSTSAADPPPPPSPSPFADIRKRLKSSPSTSPPQRVPTTPPRPASACASPPPAAPSLDDVRRSLNLFRNSQPAASSPTPSFLDIFTSKPTPANRATGANAASSPFPFAVLRESLHNHKLDPAADPLPGAKRIDWKSVFSQRQRPGAQPPPERVFGRELKERVGKGHGGAEEGLQFLRSYCYDELGKRLGDLRPAGAGKEGEWFSLEELSGRLGRLREMDKEERERAAQSGMGMDVLRDALVVLQTKDQKKTDNLSVQSMSVLMGYGGQATPVCLLGKPQEELVFPSRPHVIS